MRIPFLKADPTKAVADTQAALAAVESRLLQLAQQRTAKLLETDGTDEVSSIELLIESGERAARIYRDRLDALRDAVKRQAQEAWLKQIDATVADTAKGLARWDAQSAELQATVDKLAAQFFALRDLGRELGTPWFALDAGMASAVRTLLGAGMLERQVSWALYQASQAKGGKLKLHLEGGGLGEIGEGDLTQRLQARSASLLEMVRARRDAEAPADDTEIAA
jgi:hypothetical protein